jgi:hypothetical protein
MISDIDRLTHPLQPKSANLPPVVKLYHVFASTYVGFLAMMVVWLNVYAYEVITLSY